MVLFKKSGYDYKAYKSSSSTIDVGFGKYMESMRKIYEDKNENPLVIITDYISGMTDSFAFACMENVSLPSPIKFRI